MSEVITLSNGQKVQAVHVPGQAEPLYFPADMADEEIHKNLSAMFDTMRPATPTEAFWGNHPGLSKVADVAAKMARGATFGLSDQAIAGGRAALQDEVPFGQAYSNNLANLHLREDQLAQSDPITSKAAGVAGFVSGAGALKGLGAAGDALGAQGLGAKALSLVPDGLKPAAAIGGKVGKAFGGGAAVGGLTGATGADWTNPAQVTADAAGGATVGGALPLGLGAIGLGVKKAGQLLAKPAEGLLASVPGYLDKKALSTIQKTISDNAEGGLPGFAALRAQADAQASGPGLQMSVPQLAGGNTADLALRVASNSGPGRATALNFTQNQLDGATQRLLDAVDKHISGGNAYQMSKELSEKQAAQAGPAYEALFSPAGTGDLVGPRSTDFANAVGAKSQAQQELAAANARLNAIQGRIQSGMAMDTTYAPNDPRYWQMNSGAKAELDAAQGAYAQAQSKVARAEANRVSVLGGLRQSQLDQETGVPGATWSPKIQGLLDDPWTGPLLKRGMGRGMQLAGIDAAAEGTPLYAKDFAITGTDAEGNPEIGSVPNLRLLDAATRGINSQISDALAGANPDRTLARSLMKLKGAWIGAVDDASGGRYRPVLDAWATPAAQKDAIGFGQDVAKGRVDPEAIPDWFQSATPAEQQFARLGFASDLKQQISKVRDTGNSALPIMSSPYKRDILSRMAGDSGDVDSFLQTAQDEDKAFGFNKKVLATAGQSFDPTATAEGHLGQMAVGLLSKEPVMATTHGIRSLVSSARNDVPSGQVLNAMAPLMFSNDPAVLQKVLQPQAPRSPVLMPWLVQNTGQFGGPLYSNYLSNEGQ